MSKQNVLAGFAVGMAIIALAGCASEPTRAELMRQHVSNVEATAEAQADLKEELAKDWEEGQSLIESGNQNIEDGEKRIDLAERNLKKGEDQVERGRRELAEGKRLVRESERRFRAEFDDLELSADR